KAGEKLEDLRILIADDDNEIRNLLNKYLERELYKVDVAVDCVKALRLFVKNQYNLLILDLLVPNVDGIEVCIMLRNKTNMPILMLTAKDQKIDKGLGLGIGADDYITKPFSINEVIARVKSLMRRFLILGSDGESLEKTSIKYKDLTIDLKKYIIVIGGEEVPLTAKDFELLKFLAAHNEQVFTKTQLFRNVWESDYIED